MTAPEPLRQLKQMVMVVVEEKEDGGSLPSADALTTNLQDHAADYTRGDAELPWQVRKIYPAGPPAYISPQSQETGQEVLLTLLLHPDEHAALVASLKRGSIVSDGSTGLVDRLIAAGVMQV